MLFLLFQLGNDRYALQASTVAEVLPLVNFKRIPQAQPAIAGLIDYRGVPVPVIDLNELMSGRPAAQRFSTRVVVRRNQVGRCIERSDGACDVQASVCARDPRG